MSENLYEQNLKQTQETILLECLKNITLCLFNEKAEFLRKTIESENENGKHLKYLFNLAFFIF